MAHHKQMNKEFLPLLLSRNSYKVMTTSNVYHQNIEFRGHRVQRFFKFDHIALTTKSLYHWSLFLPLGFIV